MISVVNLLLDGKQYKEQDSLLAENISQSLFLQPPCPCLSLTPSGLRTHNFRKDTDIQIIVNLVYNNC